jgi:hypothetical protein
MVAGQPVLQLIVDSVCVGYIDKEYVEQFQFVILTCHVDVITYFMDDMTGFGNSRAPIGIRFCGRAENLKTTADILFNPLHWLATRQHRHSMQVFCDWPFVDAPSIFYGNVSKCVV